MRRKVVERAGDCCEYCLLHQNLTASTHQVDHVIAEKHGGKTTLENLALSCTVCNSATAELLHLNTFERMVEGAEFMRSDRFPGKT